ncbi:MAG: hypothetical protein R3B70_46845 [Polyangiaceae bacterium]
MTPLKHRLSPFAANSRASARARATYLFALAAAALSLSACDGGTGSIAFHTWGEDYIEDEIPASDFEDGWQVTYDTFLVNIGHVRVAASDGTLGAEMTGTLLFNHAVPGQKPVITFDDLPAGPWEKVSYEVPAVTETTTLADGVTEAEKATMLAQGTSMRVVGTATKAGVEKTFDWSFLRSTLYDDCQGDRDGKLVQGALVTNGGTDQIQLTIHGDHLFYDDLQSENAVLRFDPIAAADTDADGAVTLEELSQIKLFTLDAGPYGTGSADGIDDLAAFVTALSQTVGHFRGEGECFGRPID